MALLPKLVLGTYGQVLRGGPFYESDGETLRDMSTLAVQIEMYPPKDSGPTETGVGTGTTGYIEYRIADGDFGSLGIWGWRLYAVDADENIPSARGRLRVVEPDEGA